MVKEMAYYCNIEDVAYFYHGDFCGSRAKSQTCLNYTEMQHSVRSQHLGSASWITDHDGNPVQHLQYLPYGEPFVDQHPAGYQERFRFTGKAPRKGNRAPMSKTNFSEGKDEETCACSSRFIHTKKKTSPLLKNLYMYSMSQYQI